MLRLPSSAGNSVECRNSPGNVSRGRLKKKERDILALRVSKKNCYNSKHQYLQNTDLAIGISNFF